MPIEVKHGVDTSALAALALVAAANANLKVPQMPQLSVSPSHFTVPGGGGGRRVGRRAAPRQVTQRRSHALLAAAERQDKEIEANAASQKAANEQALKKAAVEHGLDVELKEMEFDNELKLTQEKAKAKAMQWDYNFTPKQRQEMSRIQTSIQEVQSSDQYTPQEKQYIVNGLTQKLSSFQPSVIPSRGPKSPDWFDPRGTSTDPATGLRYTPENRNGQVVPKIAPNYAQPQYLQHQLEMKQMSLESKNASEWEKRRWEYVNAPVIEGDKERAPTRDEVWNRMADFRELQQGVTGRPESQVQTQQPKIPSQPQEPQQPNWWSQAEQQGIKITDSEKKLPQQVGQASAFYRVLAKDYGDGKKVDYAKLPDTLKQQYKQTIQIMNGYWGQ